MFKARRVDRINMQPLRSPVRTNARTKIADEVWLFYGVLWRYFPRKCMENINFPTVVVMGK